MSGEPVTDAELQRFAELLTGLRAKQEHMCPACGNVIAAGARIVTPRSTGKPWHWSCNELPQPSRRTLLMEERRQERAREPADPRQVGLFGET